MEKEEAQRIVNEILADLNDRSGMGWDMIDKTTQEEIRKKWVKIAMGTVPKKVELTRSEIETEQNNLIKPYLDLTKEIRNLEEIATYLRNRLMSLAGTKEITTEEEEMKYYKNPNFINVGEYDNDIPIFNGEIGFDPLESARIISLRE